MENARTPFFKKLPWGICIQNYKAEVDQFGALESQIRSYFLNIFPDKYLRNSIHYEFWYLYEMKAWLFYICLTYSIFSRNLAISNKSGKHSPTLTILKLVLALNSFMREVPTYRNQSTELPCKSMDWFLYDRKIHHERVTKVLRTSFSKIHPAD